MFRFMVWLRKLFSKKVKQPTAPPIPRWEVIPVFDGGDLEGYQVRWSVPHPKHGYFVVGSFFHENAKVSLILASNRAKELNRTNTRPTKFPLYRERMEIDAANR